MHTKLFKLSLVILLLIPGLSLFPVKTFAETKIAQLTARPQVFDLNNIVVTYKNNPTHPKLISLDGSKGLNRHPLPSDSLEQNSPEFAARQTALRQRMEEYMNDPDVVSVQPQYIYKLDSWTRNINTDTPDDFDLNPTPSPTATATPLEGNHWYYEKEHLRELWKDQDCLNAGAHCGGSQSIVVAVIDTGLAYETRTSPFSGDVITKNPDMFNGSDNIHLWQNTAEINGNAAANCSDELNTSSDTDGIRDDCYGLNATFNVYCTPTDVDVPCTNEQWAEEGHPFDDYGHGTYVTGLISSLVDNAAGSVSPAFNVAIMPIKASDQYQATFGSQQIAAALDFAITHGADVINMSFSSASPLDSVVQAKILQAYESGITIVAASGNGNTAVGYPAAYNGVIGVGAVNANDSKSSYSNFGSQLSVVSYVGEGSGKADGVYQNTMSCYFPTSPKYDCASTNDYSTFEEGYQAGTSFAAPQVSALAAILLSEEPALSPDQVKYFIQSTATDLGTAGFDNNTGWGAINYDAAYMALTGDVAPTDITILQPDGVSDTANGTYNITWTDSDPDDDAKINLYLDTNTNPADQTLKPVPGCPANISEDDPADNCNFTSRYVPNGNYYIYACINDFRLVPLCNYSSGTVTVANTVLRESGKLLATSAFKHVTFTTAFTQTPVVITQITSNYGTDKIYYNIKNVNSSGFDVQIQEKTQAGYDGAHNPEDVSWYAIQNATAEEQLGFIDINQTAPGNWTQINFYPEFASVPKVLATIQSENGVAIAYVDFRNVAVNGFQMRVEEPYPDDGIHVNETIGWLAFVSSTAATNTATVGSVTSTWKPVTFAVPFSETPSLLAEVETENGTDRCSIDIRNLTATGFEVRIEEDPHTQDGIHNTAETIAYAAYPYTVTRQSSTLTATSAWTLFFYDKPFNTTPKIFAEINSENNSDMVAVDLRNITPLYFEMRLEEDLKAGWDGNHPGETVTYLAMTQESAGEKLGIVSPGFPATATANAWHTIPFGTTFGSAPKVFAEIQTENGGDTVEAHIKNVTTTTFDYRIEEDIKAGWDGNHTAEAVAWLAFETPSAGQTGSVSLNGPVALNNNWVSVVFPTPFASTPKLIADLNTEAGADTVAVDIRNETATGFQVRIEEQKYPKYDGIHGAFETVSWYAWP